MKLHNFVSGVFLVILGCILLLKNFGLLPLGVWEYVVNLWPLALVLIGIHRLTQHNNQKAESQEPLS